MALTDRATLVTKIVELLLVARGFFRIGTTAASYYAYETGSGVINKTYVKASRKRKLDRAFRKILKRVRD